VQKSFHLRHFSTDLGCALGATASFYPRDFMARMLCVALLAAAMGCFAGCTGSRGPAKKTCYPVKGQLLVQGKPAEGALIIFRPAAEAKPEEWSAGFPRAHVASDGTFEVGTYDERDGAPAGDYVLSVSWVMPNPLNEEAPGIDKLAGRYADAATSKLTAKVEPRPTDLPAIRLP
jgi:hypothetical protein